MDSQAFSFPDTVSVNLYVHQSIINNNMYPEIFHTE